jgi:hypothetical protein
VEEGTVGKALSATRRLKRAKIWEKTPGRPGGKGSQRDQAFEILPGRCIISSDVVELNNLLVIAFTLPMHLLCYPASLLVSKHEWWRKQRVL